MADERIKLVCPHQVGWLHRPELDQGHVEVWERPDGKLHAHDTRRGALMLNILRWGKEKFYGAN